MLGWHVGRALLGEDPRIGATRVENAAYFLGFAASDVQLTDVGQILRICQWLLDLDIGELTQSDCLFKLSGVT